MVEGMRFYMEEERLDVTLENPDENRSETKPASQESDSNPPSAAAEEADPA